MSTDKTPDPFAELRNLLAENARLRARLGVLEHQEKIGHAPQDHNALNDACVLLGCPVGVNRVDWLRAFAKELRYELNFDEEGDVDLIAAAREYAANSSPGMLADFKAAARMMGVNDDDMLSGVRELITQRDNLLFGAQRVTEALIKAKMLRAKDTWHMDAASMIREHGDLVAKVIELQQTLRDLHTEHAPEPEPTPARWPMPFPPTVAEASTGEGIVFADGPIDFPSARAQSDDTIVWTGPPDPTESDIIVERTSNASIPVESLRAGVVQSAPPVGIEAVFAGASPVPEGWRIYNGHLQHGPVKFWSDCVVLIGGAPSTARRVVRYPTIARAWEVAQDIAARLDAGEEVNELPPAVEPEPPAMVEYEAFKSRLHDALGMTTGFVDAHEILEEVGAVVARMADLEAIVAELKGGR